MKRAAALAGLAVLTLGCGVKSAAAQKPAHQKPTNEDCLACHGDPSLTKDVNGKPVSLQVDPDKFKNSMHGGMFSCVDCHSDVKTAPHDTTPARVSCATCHSDAQAAYERSLHAKAVQNGKAAATCASCHGSPHELLPASDSHSRTNHANIPATCGTCHNQKIVMDASGRSIQQFTSYQESVHGRAVANGVGKAAVCTDCHASHEILMAGDPKSSTFKFNVPGTCGKCHESVEHQFKESIHGQAIARGQWQAPVCTDCHGVHSIASRNDPSSPTAAQNLAQNTCARCHEGVRLSREFGFEANRVTTYLASYHGLASQSGSQVVANCASCHGVHNILPPGDPRSTIHPANLVHTCGQCHRGVTQQFVAAKVHVNAPLSTDIGSNLVRWVKRFYFVLIVLVIGAMLAHNAIVWRYKAIVRRNRAGQLVTRMSRLQRIQHNVLFVSFTVLVVTGFALTYPDSWLAYLMLGMGESARRIIHRIAALVLIGVGVYHLFYALFTAEGRRMLGDILPTPRDVSDSWRNLRYHLRMDPQKPAFGRFSYAEKIEYWALVWGTILMAVTGLMLWAKVAVGNHLPRWWLDVATAVHFYEAVLATLAIAIWHFYQVFFDPDTHPMNWAWWDGKVPLEHYRAEHALDVQVLLDAEHGEAKTEPKPATSQETEKGSDKTGTAEEKDGSGK